MRHIASVSAWLADQKRDIHLVLLDRSNVIFRTALDEIGSDAGIRNRISAKQISGKP
jgi:hypothetical protein